MEEHGPDLPESSREVWIRIPDWLRRLGMLSWLLTGVILCAATLFSLFSLVSSLLTPFIIALVCGALFYPWVDRLEKMRVPRLWGSLLVVLLLAAVVAAVVWITAVGILGQSAEMIAHVRRGFEALADRAEGWQVPAPLIEQISDQLMEQTPAFASGLVASFTSSISGVFGMFMATFAAVFLLFILLHDWHNVVRWVFATLGMPTPLGQTVVSDATGSIREYFNALTVSSIIVSVSIGGTMALPDLPLAVSIGLVTMITSYIPYLGAIFSGAFAALVALGSGGIGDALVVLGMVLLMQNVIQTIIQNRMASRKLKLHPIVTFTSVIAGGILFGVLGAALANPVVALFQGARRRFREYRAGDAAPDRGANGVSTAGEAG